MEYFTLSEEIEKNRGLKSYTSNRIFICLAILFLLFLTRSFGFVNVEFNKVYLVGNQTSQRQTYKLYNNGKNFEEGEFNSTLKIDTEQTHRYLFLRFGVPSLLSSDRNDLKDSIRNKIAGESILKKRFDSSTITVKKIETSGLYWLPLIKHGTSSYQVSIENNLPEDYYAADFSGEIDFGVYGVCTTGKLKSIIAERIGSAVVDSIKKDYQK